MELSQQLNKIASDKGTQGKQGALLAIAALVLLDKNNDVQFDADDLPGTLARLVRNAAIPVYYAFPITLAQIQALGASLTGSIDMPALPAGSVVFDFQFVTTETFAGPGPLTAAGINIVTEQRRLNAVPTSPMNCKTRGFQTPDNSDKIDMNSVLPAAQYFDSETPWHVEFVLEGCNAEDLTGGALTMWLSYAVLPNLPDMS